MLWLNVGFIAAFGLRFQFDINPRNFDAYIKVAPVFSVAFVSVLFAFDLYRRRRITVRTVVSSIGRPILLTALFGASFVLFTGWFSFPRTIIFLGFALGGPLVLCWRIVLAKLEGSYRGSERLLAVIDQETMGDGDQRETLRRLGNISAENTELIGVLDHRQIDRIIDMGEGADVVIISAAVPEASRAQLTGALLARSVRVFLIPAAFDLALHTGRLSNFYTVEGIELSDGSLPPAASAIKRSIDVVSSASLLLLSAPIALLAAVLIKLDGPGPIIYRQKRVGKDRRPFVVLKFRTMKVDAESETGAVFASRNDPRLTRVGRFLRSSRIDEIPQMWNVLKGEMSMVGPRPERPEFVSVFVDSVPAYTRRFVVRPGVTGLAQVRGGYAASPEEKLRFDLLYINQMSFIGDLRIAVQTVSTMLDFRSAEGGDGSDHLPEEVEALLDNGAGAVVDLRDGQAAIPLEATRALEG